MAGLYVHIPLCASKCAYCDFYSVAGEASEKIVEALKREMSFRRDFAGGAPLDTIYIGGGTPSLLPPERLQGLLDHAAELWDCSSLKETTVEANPEDLTDDYIARLAETGFNRISIGIQSFDDSLLRMMNRRHDAQRAKDAVRSAQRRGFRNISVDLIFGIPSMTDAQWERSLDEAIGLGVQHISAYHLTIEPGTTFGKMARRDAESSSPTAFRPVNEAESERQYATLRRKSGEAGFEHYEISNFALPGRRAVHNGAYWNGAPYLGIGPSAHSFDGTRRREWVAGDVAGYMKNAGKTTTIYGSEILTDAELFNERIMTALRTVEGMDLERAAHDFGAEKMAALMRRAEKFLTGGLLVKKGNRIAIPPEKFLLSDYVISALFE